MLKGVFVVIGIVVIVVRIGKEVVILCKNDTRANRGFREEYLFGNGYRKGLFFVIIKIFTHLKPKVCISLSIANNLYWVLYSDTTMIGGYDDGDSLQS